MGYVLHIRSLNVHGNWRLYNNIVDAANSVSSSSLLSHKLQPGFPEINQIEGEPVYMIRYDNSKQADILGIKFRTKLETTKDTLDDFVKRGW